MEYQVVETFLSINGEGQRAGELAYFIRFKGCNLNCNYCDTAWANETGASFISMNQQQIVEKIKESGARNVTLTGGEPLLRPGIALLIEEIMEHTECFIEIETNGSQDIQPFLVYGERVAFTLDYKLPGSGIAAETMNCHQYAYLRKQDTVKFVVSGKEDLEIAREKIMEYHLQGKCGVYLSPVFGRIEARELVNYVMEYKLNQVHVQLQLHKFIWDPAERGV